MGVAVRATETVTFFRRKPAHCCCPGGCIAGACASPTSGSPRGVLEEIQPRTFENIPQAWRESFPVPQVDAHKYARGHALVVSGDIATTGAARMSARARCGQGRAS